MKWVNYTGQPFEGERIFKFKCGDVQKRFFYTFPEDDVVRNNLNWDQVFYLDESPSYSKEDIEKAIYEMWYSAKDGDKNIEEALIYSMKYMPFFDEWIKEREGE
jgi:hypothetical protein